MEQEETRPLDKQSPPPRRNLLRWLAVALVIGAGVTAVLFERGSGAAGWHALRRISWGPLAGALAAASGSWLLTSASLLLLTRAAGYPRSMRQIWPAYMAGNFCGLVTPFGSGGTPGQAYFVAKLGVDAGPAFAVAAARGLISSVIVASAAGTTVLLAPGWLPAGAAGGAARSALGIVAILLIAATLLVVSKQPGRWVAAWATRARRPFFRKLWGSVASETELFRRALRTVARRPAALAGAALCEVAAWVMIVAVGPLVFVALGWQGPAWAIFARVLALFLVIPLSPTPGSAGTAETGFFVVGGGLVDSYLLAPAVLLWRLIMYYLPLAVGGIAFVALGAREPRTARSASGR